MGNLRIFNLNELIRINNAPVFIETGTLYGDGIVQALRYNFDKIISIEIEPQVAERARQRFKKESRVEIITGHSTDVLKNLLPKINSNAIFWLDAHFPGADAELKSYDEIKKLDFNLNLPLDDEINLISNRLDKFKDILICDDLWVYESIKMGDKKRPSFDEHCKAHGHDITLKDINPDNKDLSLLYEKFGKTHDFKKIYRDQGYVIVYPL